MKLGIFSLWTDARDHETVYGDAHGNADLTPTPEAPVVALPVAALPDLLATPRPSRPAARTLPPEGDRRSAKRSKRTPAAPKSRRRAVAEAS